MRSTSARTKRNGRLALIASAVALVALTSACGNRVPESQVIAAEGGGTGTTATGDAGSTSTGGSLTGQGAPTVTDTSGAGAAAAPTAAGGDSSSGQTNAAGGTVGGSAPVTGGGTTATGAPAAGSATSGPSTTSKSGGGTTAQKTSAATAPKASSSAAAGGSSTAACTKQLSPIVVGQVATTSGIIGPDVGSAVPTMAVWAKYINANGGIACHPVTVDSLDDGGDPGRAQSDVSNLVGRGAVAFVANFIPLSITGFQAGVDPAKTPVVGGDLFSLTWWNDPLFYPVGTYVNANAFGQTAALAKQGDTKVAVLYCIEAAVCPPFKDAVVNNAAKGGYSIVYQDQVSITQPDYTSQCQAAEQAGAQQISMIVDGGAVNRLATSCASIGYYPKFAVASLGATFDKTNATIQKDTVTIASAASSWFSASNPAEQAFQTAMKQYAPTLALDPTTILAWADGMMLKDAIEKVPAARTGNVTSAMIQQGLSMEKGQTLGGLIPPNDFGAVGTKAPTNLCYYGEVYNGQWQHSGSNYACLS